MKDKERLRNSQIGEDQGDMTIIYKWILDCILELKRDMSGKIGEI